MAATAYPSVETLQRRIRELELENEALRREHVATRDRERSLLEIVVNTPAPIYLKDAELRYILVNPRYEQVSHLVGATLVGKTDHQIFPPPIAELFRAQDLEVIEAGRPCEFEETVDMPDGAFTFITVKFPVYDAGGRLRAVGGFCTDITARKKLDAERERLLAELQTAALEVATLRGILPICAWCKCVRDDHGYWSKLESYLAAHSELEFSHGICPKCLPKLEGQP